MVNYDPQLPSFQTRLPTLPVPAGRKNSAVSAAAALDPLDGAATHNDRCDAQPAKRSGHHTDNTQQADSGARSQHRSPPEAHTIVPHLRRASAANHHLRPSSSSSSLSTEQNGASQSHFTTLPGSSSRSVPHEGPKQAGGSIVKTEEDDNEASKALHPKPPPHVLQPATHTHGFSTTRPPYVSSNTFDRPQASFQSSYQRRGDNGDSTAGTSRHNRHDQSSGNNRPLLPSRSPSPLPSSPGGCDCETCNRSGQSPVTTPEARDGDRASRNVRWGDSYDRRSDAEHSGRDVRGPNLLPPPHWNDRERPTHQETGQYGPHESSHSEHSSGSYYTHDPRQGPQPPPAGWHDPNYSHRHELGLSPHHSTYSSHYHGGHQRYHPYDSSMSPSSGSASGPWPYPPPRPGSRSPVGTSSKVSEKTVKHKSRKTWTEVEWKKLMDLAERSKKGDPRNDIDWEFVTLGFGGKRCRQGILTVAAKRGLKVSTREARTISKRALSSDS